MDQQQLFKVRDLRKKDQFKIDDAYLNGYAKILGVYSTAVYNSLCRHAEFNTQKAFPSEKLIAKEHGITERCVRNEVRKLKDANIITIKKERSSKGQWLNNLYILLDKSEWTSPKELKDLWKTKGTERPNQRNLTTLPEELKVPLRIHIKKDTNKKDNKEKDIFNYWNKQKIIVHSKLTDKMKTKIKSALKDYEKDKIFLAIRKYKMVLAGSEYFWTYLWSLDQFLQRGLTDFFDSPVDKWKKSNGFEKPKKRRIYFQGDSVVEKDGKRWVIQNGEWKEFCGEEKDLVVKFE